MKDRPIGMFDSGVGGITIYREVHRLLPNESVIYLADSKNAPYGEKTQEHIVDLSIKNTEFLLKHRCKLIIVACNTASTNAVAELRKKYPIPFIRVQPAIKPAALNSKTKVVGILATNGTLKSNLLHETSQKFAQGVEVIHQVGEGLVSLIEKGKTYSEDMTSLLHQYLDPMLGKNIDHLVLGCTHYPLIKPQIEAIVGSKVKVLDSGEAIARQTKVILEQEQLIQTISPINTQQFYTNINPTVFQSILKTINKEFTAQQIDF